MSTDQPVEPGRPGVPGGPGGPGERVMVVARCGGHRCAALSRSRTGPDAVAGALRERRDGVLMSTGCQGRCHAGAVAAVGWARAGRGSLCWERPPAVVEQVETDRASASLAAWLQQERDSAADYN